MKKIIERIDLLKVSEQISRQRLIIKKAHDTSHKYYSYKKKSQIYLVNVIYDLNLMYVFDICI